MQAKPTEATHVLCVEEKRTPIQTCTYGSGGFSVVRKQAAVLLTVVDVRTEQAAFVSASGDPPGPCPSSVSSKGPSTQTIEGSAVPEARGVQAALRKGERKVLVMQEVGKAPPAAGGTSVEAVRALTDQDALAKAAADRDPEVRIAAVRKLTRRATLSYIEQSDPDPRVRAAASDRQREIREY
jgi:hypothetical protein